MTITLTGDQGYTEFRRTGLSENVDARAAVFHQRQASSGDYPFNVAGAASGLQFLGGKVLGGVPTGDWRTFYSLANGNSAALRIENCPGAIIDGWTFEADPALSGQRFVWDGIRTVGSTDGYVIQNILMRGCRDDALELENGSGGTIRDSRFFDCFVFVGSDGANATGKTLTMSNLLVSMGLHSYDGKAETHQSPFKANKAGGNPKFALDNVVIAIRDPFHSGSLEAGSRLRVAFAGMSATNCHYLNLSDTPLPSNYPPRPAGFTTLQGQAARDYWDNRVSMWGQPPPPPEPEDPELEARVAELEAQAVALSAAINALAAALTAVEAKLAAASAALA